MAQQSENANLDYRSSYHLDCPAEPRALALKVTKLNHLRNLSTAAIPLVTLLTAALADAGDSRKEVCVAKSVAELSSQNSVVVVQKVEAGVVKIPGPLLRFYDVTLSVQSAAKTTRHEFRCRDDGVAEVAIVQRRTLP